MSAYYRCPAVDGRRVRDEDDAARRAGRCPRAGCGDARADPAPGPGAGVDGPFAGRKGPAAADPPAGADLLAGPGLAVLGVTGLSSGRAALAPSLRRRCFDDTPPRQALDLHHAPRRLVRR